MPEVGLELTHYVTRIQEGLVEGVCVIKLHGRITLGESGSAFRTYIEQRISDGIRFIVLDCTEIVQMDSSGLGELASALTRIRMRGGKLILLNSKSINKYLELTRLTPIFTYAESLTEAMSICQGEVVQNAPEIKYEEKFSIAMTEEKGAKKLVVNDKFSGEPIKTEYNVREIPPPEESKTLSPKWLILVVATALVTLAVTVWGLVWVATTVSSVLLLTLISALALLFFILLSALVLLLSGHLSEKAAAKLFGGVLGKIPGLGVWVPKTSRK